MSLPSKLIQFLHVFWELLVSPYIVQNYVPKSGIPPVYMPFLSAFYSLDWNFTFCTVPYLTSNVLPYLTSTSNVNRPYHGTAVYYRVPMLNGFTCARNSNGIKLTIMKTVKCLDLIIIGIYRSPSVTVTRLLATLRAILQENPSPRIIEMGISMLIGLMKWNDDHCTIFWSMKMA